MNENKLHIGMLVKTTLNALFANYGTWILWQLLSFTIIAAATVGIAAIAGFTSWEAIASTLTIPEKLAAAAPAIFIASFLILLIFASANYAGIQKIFMADSGKQIDIYPIFVWDMEMALLTVIKFFSIGLAYAFFFFPGIYLSTRWLMADYILVDQKCGALAALRKSWEMSDNQFGEYFGFYVVISLSYTIRHATGIGAFALGPIERIFLGTAYKELQGRGQQNPT